MIDWRGQAIRRGGCAIRARAMLRDFSDFEIDVETFVQQVVLPDCRRPISRWRIRWGSA